VRQIQFWGGAGISSALRNSGANYKTAANGHGIATSAEPAKPSLARAHREENK